MYVLITPLLGVGKKIGTRSGKKRMSTASTLIKVTWCRACNQLCTPALAHDHVKEFTVVGLLDCAGNILPKTIHSINFCISANESKTAKISTRR